MCPADLRSRLGLSALVVALVLTFVVPIGADESPTGALLDALSDEYEVLTLRDGWVLRPLGTDAEFETLEVRGGEVAVDGVLLEEEAWMVLLDTEAAEAVRALAAGAVTKLPEDDTALEAAAPAAGERTEPEPEPEPERRRPASVRVDSAARFTLGGHLEVRENESAEDAVALFGSLRVLGVVRGEAFVLGDDVEIEGRVRGSVVAVGGDVYLRPGAQVDGDVVAVGGAVHDSREARVRGSVTELGGRRWSGVPDWLPFGSWRGSAHAMAWRALHAGALLVFALVLGILLARPLRTIEARIRREPLKAGLVGLVIQILLLPTLLFVMLALAVSIVGIPLLLLIPLLVLVVILLFLLGYASSAVACARSLLGKGAPIVALLVVGVVLIQVWSIVGDALRLVGGPLLFFGWMLLAFGFVVQWLAWTVGLGGVALHMLTPRR